MMEIVDNNEEKKSLFSNKKVIAAVSGVAALLVVWVGVFVFTGAGKADAVNADPSSVDTVDPGKIEGLNMVKTDDNGMSLDFTAANVDDIDLTDPNVDLYAQDVVDSTGGWVAASTGIES